MVQGKEIYGLFLCLILSLNSYAQSIFTGSTPADAPVRAFLKIDNQIPIDFIRWQLNLEPSGKYLINIKYDEGQPNTLGFKNGGKFAELSGEYTTGSANGPKIITLKSSAGSLMKSMGIRLSILRNVLTGASAGVLPVKMDCA